MTFNKRKVAHIVETEERTSTEFPNQKFKKDRTMFQRLENGSFNRIDKLDASGKVELDKYGRVFMVFPAMQAIGRAIRDYFEGSYPTWATVPMDAKKRLWYEFGMKCKWNENDELVAEAWNRYCKLNYTELVYRAHKMFKKGKTKYKWTHHDTLAKFWIYWTSAEYKKKAKKAKKN